MGGLDASGNKQPSDQNSAVPTWQPGQISSSQWVPTIYAELRRLAAEKMAHEAPGQTLQATALVHEAWLRLGADAQPRWESRAHFFASAAEAMRRILIEAARRKQRLKHGGHLERVNADEIDLPMVLPMETGELLMLDEALNRLLKVNARATQVVNLCFFLGLTHEEAARELGVSLSTVERLWSFARAWLFGELRNASKLPNSTGDEDV